MKRFKVTASALAIAFALTGAFAFQEVPAAATGLFAEKWFEYIGDPDDASQQTQASSYVLYNGTGSTPTCNSSADLCAVQLQTDASGTKPLASDVSNISDDPKRRHNP